MCVPEWSSWAGCRGLARLSGSSRGLGGFEMTPPWSRRSRRWNPPCPRRCFPPSGFRKIRPAYIPRVEEIVFCIDCHSAKHGRERSGCSQSHLQSTSICCWWQLTWHRPSPPGRSSTRYGCESSWRADGPRALAACHPQPPPPTHHTARTAQETQAGGRAGGQADRQGGESWNWVSEKHN